MGLNDDVFDGAVSHQIHLNRLNSGIIRRIRELLVEIDLDLAARIESRLDRLSAADLQRISSGIRSQQTETQRLVALREMFDQIAIESEKAFEEKITEEMAGVASYEANFQKKILDSAISPLAIVEIAVPSAKILESAIRSRPIAGRFLKDIVSDWSNSKQKDVERAVIVGISEGENPRKIARRIRGTKANGYTDGVISASRRRAETIARTSFTHVANFAHEETYKRNSNVIRGVEYIAILDRRTSHICRSLDGQIYKIGEGPRPPQHPNCRSTTRPVIKRSRDIEDIEIKEGKSKDFNLKSDRPLTYSQWLKKQSVSTQQEILGIKKQELFAQGKIELKDLLDDDGSELTLSELEAKLNT